LNVIITKFKEVLYSVLPIVFLVLILNFTVTPLGNILMIRFMLGSLFVVIGLTVFLFGVDIGITPLGGLTGKYLTSTNRVWIVLLAGLIVGFFISIAEPGLLVLTNQVDLVTSGEISSFFMLVIVSIGLAVMLSLGFLRILYNYPLFKILLVLYMIIFVLALFTTPEFLAISFDASGSTTGILAVPFILALSVSVSRLKKDSKASEKDSFGLIAIASTGTIISVMIIGFFIKTSEFSASLQPRIIDTESIFSPFFNIVLEYFGESFMAITPLVGILWFLQNKTKILNKRQLRRLFTGIVFSFLGLLTFFIGINGGFMEVASEMGNQLALLPNRSYIIIFAFILGVVTIIAEPAVNVLTHQIEDVTSGYVKRNIVLVTLAIGVGFAIVLSVVRVMVPQIQLWHYLLPGYLISLGLMFVVPKLFVGIAFDAGGVATGPITVTFILAFIQGAANAFEGADLMIDGFGMIAIVALMPIITLEILGLFFKLNSLAVERKKKNEQ
jgi:hypothetical protein